MPKLSNYREDTLTAGGGTINYSTTEDKELYLLVGTATLSSSWTVQSTGTSKKGMEFRIRKTANITLNGNNLTIFGTALNSVQALKDCTITATYDGSAWDVIIKIDSEESGIITTEDLADDSVTDDKIATATIDIDKIATQASPGILGFDNTGVSSFITLGDGQIPLGNAAIGLAGVTVSGAITIDSSGVATIPDSSISASKLDFSLDSLQILERTLSISEVLSLDPVTTITLVDAQGTGKVIQVVSACMFLDFNSAAYTAGADLTLLIGTVAVGTFSQAAIQSGVDRYQTAEIDSSSVQVRANIALTLGVTSAFLTGDSPIKLNIAYRILDFN
jgi:hypothetical protein